MVSTGERNGGTDMSIRVGVLATAAVIAVSVPLMPEVASATSMPGALAIQDSATANVLDIGWRRRRGLGVGAGIVGGVVIGRALAAPYYYGPYDPDPYDYYSRRSYYPDRYYDPGPRYYSAPYRRAPAYADQDYADTEAYCIERFRSYDPDSGTYLGYDGYRHPCP